MSGLACRKPGLRGDDLEVVVALDRGREALLAVVGRRGPRSALELDDVDLLVAELVDDPLTGLLALDDEVGAEEAHVERLVLRVDRAVGQDDGDVGGLGLLEHGVPAGLDDRGERDDVDPLGDVGPDRLDLVLLLLLRVGELQVEAGLLGQRVLDGLRVGGAPAALRADLREADGDEVPAAPGVATGVGLAARVRVSAAARGEAECEHRDAGERTREAVPSVLPADHASPP
jgi:hypothetical protein